VFSKEAERFYRTRRETDFNDRGIGRYLTDWNWGKAEGHSLN
jgi:hypothetical protein